MQVATQNCFFLYISTACLLDDTSIIRILIKKDAEKRCLFGLTKFKIDMKENLYKNDIIYAEKQPGVKIEVWEY